MTTILFFLHLKVGMTVLVDHSGKLFTKERCTIRDIITNQEVSQRVEFKQFVVADGSVLQKETSIPVLNVEIATNNLCAGMVLLISATMGRLNSLPYSHTCILEQ